jgi:cytochrome P450
MVRDVADGIDLSDVDIFVAERHPQALAWLRENAPVYWNRSAHGPDFWALTRYEDILWAYRNHAALSSRNGVIVGGSYRSERDSASGRMLVTTDLPRHRMLKSIIQPALSAEVVRRVVDQVQRLTRAAVGRLVRAGGGDFSTEVSDELPAAALMVVFGISHAEAHEVIGLTHRMIGFREQPNGGAQDPELLLAWTHAEILEFLVGLVARRRHDPGDDIASLLLRSRVNGRPMSEEDVVYNCLNMAVGGNETSTYTASVGMRALIEYPDQHVRLRSDPALLPSAVEEMLRWGSVAAYVQRMALQDIVLRGETIRAGDMVTLWNFSANRDERQFPHSDTFDVGRSPNRHVSYGTGIHRCIGAPVAQRELTTLFGEVLRSGARVRMTGPPRLHRSNFILGITRLPVEVVDTRGPTDRQTQSYTGAGPGRHK